LLLTSEEQSYRTLPGFSDWLILHDERRSNSARTVSMREGRITVSIFFMARAAYEFRSRRLATFWQLLIAACTRPLQIQAENGILELESKSAGRFPS
jgi:hypothetical protein